MLLANSKFFDNFGWCAPVTSAKGKYLMYLGSFPTYQKSEIFEVYCSDIEEMPIEFYYSDFKADYIVL